MSVENTPAFETALTSLRGSYGTKLPSRIEQIESQLQQVIHEQRGLLGEAATRLLQLVHKTAGSAATFGFSEVSAAARELEDLLLSIMQARQLPGNAQIEKANDILRKLKEAALQHQPVHEASKRGTVAESGLPNRTIILISDQSDALDMTEKCLNDIGFVTLAIQRIEDALDQLPKVIPSAVLVSSANPRWELAVKMVSKKSQRLTEKFVPVICISTENSFDTQLKALRAGADGLLVDPLQADDVLQLINKLSSKAVPEPIRVLIVENDDNLILQCASALEGPGYKTQICRDPHQLFLLIKSFDPEVLVVELNLPQCSGLEIAKIVWRNNFRKNIEIVFLLSASGFSDAASKLGLTSERFITKPVNANQLRCCLAHLVFESRTGRDCPARDHFIALLNNQAYLSQLNQILGIGERLGRQLISTPEVQKHSRPKVLVVDDDPFMVQAIAAKLESLSLQALLAYSSAEALTLAHREKPDLIISDFDMPGGSADYLLSRLKGDVATMHIPVMILTGRKVGGGKDHALARDLLGRLGAVSYISKPVNWSELESELRYHINR